MADNKKGGTASRRAFLQGAGGLGVLTAIAMLTANNFWALTGHDRFIAVNTFFEHLGLIAGLILMCVLTEAKQHP